MSKLFWLQGYRQLKLITTLNQDTKSTGCLLLSPGQGHEINLGENIGDRGFCSRKLFERFIRNGALFIIRIQSNWKGDENYRIATRYLVTLNRK
jgi:putative transposase